MYFVDNNYSMHRTIIFSIQQQYKTTGDKLINTQINQFNYQFKDKQSLLHIYRFKLFIEKFETISMYQPIKFLNA